VHGVGFIAGSLGGSKGGDLGTLRRRFLYGLFLIGVALVATGAAPTYAVALATIALAGFGNGTLLIYERLIIQATVPDEISARVYGARDSLTAWGFGVAFISAGALLSALDLRLLIVASGVVGLAGWLVAAIALRRTEAEAVASSGAPSVRRNIGTASLGGAGPDVPTVKRSGGLHNRPQFLHGSDFWLALLDDLDQSGGDLRVELASRVGGDLR
jgi:MFS family permease